MPAPQEGIFENAAPHQYFLEYTLPDPGASEELARVLARVRERTRSDGAVRLVMGFSRALWATLAAEEAPSLPAPFKTLTGKNGKTVPGTQNDLWLWFGAAERDKVFAAAMQTQRMLGPLATLRLEQPAFQFLDSRDLTGFIDGTANPQGDQARATALIPQGQAGQGGSYLLAMRWVHDLAAFHALPLLEQERVIGRSKGDSEELAPREKPANAHISRVEIEREGEELAIFRRSVPFGTLAHQGLYFLAFSADPERFDLMLAAMYGLTPDGIEDRLTDFSRADAAAYYFAPSSEALHQALGGL